MSSLLFAELAATCNALGYNDGNKYYIDTHCVETIKDLIRYLRRDDEHHTIRRHLGEAKVLQTDLIPILKQYWEKTEIFDVVLRLLVNLTNPALLLYQEELPADKTARNHYLQIISHLQTYKEVFTDEMIWAVVSKKLGTMLQTEWQDRSEDTSLIIERMLILVRNVLQVPSDPEAEKRTDNDASIHDQILWALNNSGIVDIFLYIASTDNEQTYYMHILENISLMLREQKPSELANAAPERSTIEKEKDEGELVAIRMQEKTEKEQKVKKFTGARHSRFGGTYVIKDMKSISDQDLIYHKPLHNLGSLNFDREKAKVKTPKNRRPMKGEKLERRSAFGIRLFLKKFCVEFLLGAYNPFMHHVKDNLSRARAQANDESYYLWAMKFFMEFNRHYRFHIKYVSETMSIQTFHFVQTQLENCRDMMQTDKKKKQLWSRRMHLALRAYQELLSTLMAMDKSDEENIRSSAKVIKTNLFYVIEYRELILQLLFTFDEVKLSRAYLKDLIETAHIFLKMLEQCCSTQHLTVQRALRAKGKPKKKKQGTKARQAQNPEELFDELAPQVSVVLQGTLEIPDTIIPFDATSDRNIDDQKVDAMCKIQVLLREQKFEDAVAFLRASREVWPEDDIFGNANMAPEEELLILREIFMAELPSNQIEPAVEEENPEEEDEDSDENEEAEAMGTAMAEQDFKFTDFEKRLVAPHVIRSCGIILRQFEKNEPFTNHCVVKLLHRVAWNCKMPSMLFQATLFHTFQRILESKNPQHKELAKFAIFIIRKFAEIASNNGKVYMELLFWKNHRDAFEIEQGYGSYKTQTQSGKLSWGEEEEDELRRLYEEYMSKDGASTGVVDFIMENIINKDRSKRGVVKKLKDMGFYIETKRPSKRPPKEWEEQEEQQLRELFETHRESQDPLGVIMSSLAVSRSKNQIVNKLLELGLIHDRKEVRKKRTRKSRTAEQSSGEESNKSDSDSESNEDDEFNERNMEATAAAPNRPTQAARPKNRKKPVPRQQKKTLPSKKSVKRKPVLLSVAEVSKLLEEVINEGKREALQWVSESLEEEATDRENEQPEEGIPLLPLMEPCVMAMEDSKFLTLLEALGICRPKDEQEMYWRIPPTLNSHELHTRARVILQALDGQLPSAEDTRLMVDLSEGEDEEDNDESNSAQRNDTSSSEDEFEKLRRFTNRNVENENTVKDQISQQSSSSVPKKTKKASFDTSVINHNSTAKNNNETTKKSARKKKVVRKESKPSNSDDEMRELKRIQSQINRMLDSDSDENHEMITEEGNKVKKVRNVRKRIMGSDSDESNHNETEEVDTAVNKIHNKKIRALDSDSENEVSPRANATQVKCLQSKKKGVLDFDSDDENLPEVNVASSQIQKKRILDSDSDDLPEVNTSQAKSSQSQKKNALDSDSDNDNSSHVKSSQSQKKRTLDSNSDDENLPEVNISQVKSSQGKKKRILDSDSDENLPLLKKQH